MHHFDRNALFLTRVLYYLRAVGSEESPAVRAELEHLKRVIETGLTDQVLDDPQHPYTQLLVASVLQP